MDVDLDWAHITARTAQTARVGQTLMLRWLERRVKDRADRPPHGDPVAVATAAAINGTCVEARTAADAIERASEISAAEQLASAIVDKNNVQLAPRLGAMEMRRVRCDGLTGCRTGKQPQEDAEVGQSRYQFFDSHTGDMHIWQRDAQVGVAFVCADHEPARLGDGEIHARDSRLGLQELLTQMLASRLDQVRRIRRTRGRSKPLVKKLADFLFHDVDGWRHDVAGMLVAQLYDPFAKVSVGN